VVRLKNINRCGKQLRHLLDVLEPEQKKVTRCVVRVDSLTRQIHTSKEYRAAIRYGGSTYQSKCQDCLPALRQRCRACVPYYKFTEKDCRKVKKYLASELLKRR